MQVSWNKYFTWVLNSPYHVIGRVWYYISCDDKENSRWVTIVLISPAVSILAMSIPKERQKSRALTHVNRVLSPTTQMYLE